MELLGARIFTLLLIQRRLLSPFLLSVQHFSASLLPFEAGSFFVWGGGCPLDMGILQRGYQSIPIVAATTQDVFCDIGKSALGANSSPVET